MLGMTHQQISCCWGKKIKKKKKKKQKNLWLCSVVVFPSTRKGQFLLFSNNTNQRQTGAVTIAYIYAPQARHMWTAVVKRIVCLLTVPEHHYLQPISALPQAESGSRPTSSTPLRPKSNGISSSVEFDIRSL